MSKRTKAWGFWTQIKLDSLEKYLNSFWVASRKKTATIIYLDLFAGEVDNVRKDDSSVHFDGSTVRALEIMPSSAILRFFEMNRSKAENLKIELNNKFPNDNRYEVILGDCNHSINQVLMNLQNNSWAPTFAFLDPFGLNVNWSTLRAIADFKQPRIEDPKSRVKTKAEMWVLLADPSIPRQAGWDDKMKPDTDKETSLMTTNLYGTDAWREIRERVMKEEIEPKDARRLYVDLFRYCLESRLGYKFTLALHFIDKDSRPQYAMIFATDHPAGMRIMRSVYKNTIRQLGREAPKVVERTKRRKMADRGQEALFEDIPESLPDEFQYRPILSIIEGTPNLPTWLQEKLEPDLY